MSHDKPGQGSRPIRFLFENSIFLVTGAALALIWANVEPEGYHHFVDLDLGKLVFNIDPPPAKHGHGHGGHGDGHGDAHEDGAHHGEPAAHDGSHAAPGDADGGHGEATHGDDGAPAVAGTDGGPGDGKTPGDAAHADAEHEPGVSAETPDESTAAAGSATAGSQSARAPPKGFLAAIYYAISGAHGLTVHFIINDMLMALFFAIATKEVWESLLPGGALANPRKAATPLLATLGGIVGPAGLYLVGCLVTGTMDDFGRGWAIPCATDIAFSYLVARLIFGAGHPAIAFLLLLAIADDAAGLVILAVFYPQEQMQYQWFLLTIAAMGTCFAFRSMRLRSFWFYLLIPGVMSWLSFKLAGVHAALGLVPIIPCLPHAQTDLGIFARKELQRDDTLNAFEHWWKNPVELILGLFGLANAGVAVQGAGVGTLLVLVGLLIGKPLGITGFTWFAEKCLRLEVPKGMSYRHILTLGMIAGIGFTVALFVSTAAFPPGPVLEQVKMGALGSFLAAALAFIIAKMLGIRPLRSTDGKQDGAEDSAEGGKGEPVTPAVKSQTGFSDSGAQVPQA